MKRLLENDDKSSSDTSQEYDDTRDEEAGSFEKTKDGFISSDGGNVSTDESVHNSVGYTIN